MERQSHIHEREAMTKSDGRDSDRADHIQEDIHRTRERIDETLDAIKHQLSAGDLMSQVLNMFRGEGQGMSGKAGDVLSSLARTVKDNPIPVALIGIGLLGLAKDGGGKSRSFERTTSTGGSMHGGDVTERVQDLAAQAREKVGEKTAEMRDKVEEKADEARETLERVRERIEDDPIVLGALGIALGAALGAGLPSTRIEDQTFGEKRDELAAKAKHMGEQLRQGVRQVADETMQSMRS